MSMNDIRSELKPTVGRRNWRAQMFLVLAILAFAGTFRVSASEVYYQYDAFNCLTEADYPAGTQVVYVNDQGGNRLGEAVGVVSVVNQHLTIQFNEWGGTAPLQYAPEVFDGSRWYSDSGHVSTTYVSFGSYDLVTATDSTAGGQRLIRLNAILGISQNPIPVIPPSSDVPLLPLWAMGLFGFALVAAGLGAIKSRRIVVPEF
jgi:hypothetical protein